MNKLVWREVLREHILNPRKYSLPTGAIEFKVKETTQEEVDACFAEIREILNEDITGTR